jgi:hypothetical protein
MSRKYVMSTLMATALIATALSVVGCKKGEKAEEAAPAPAQQTAAPAQQAAPPAARPGTTGYDFESGVSGWTGTDATVKVEQSSEKKHSGNSSLKVSGTSSEKQYNFVISPKFALEPGKSYKLSAWILIDSIDDAKLPPLVKTATYKDGKWVANTFSKNYNLKRTGQWQELTVSFEAPQGKNVSALVSLEKGANKANGGTIYLDNVVVEPAQ